jgi:hypothetical protein
MKVEWIYRQGDLRAEKTARNFPRCRAVFTFLWLKVDGFLAVWLHHEKYCASRNIL